MFENLLVVAIVATLIWVISFGIYLYTSRQHKDIFSEIEAVENMLGPNHAEQE